MCGQELTREKACKAFEDFFREKPFVFFGSGMSCAVDSRFGMCALRDVLLREMADLTKIGVQLDEWRKAEEALQRGSDLESALDHVSDVSLLRAVTKITGEFIAKADRECAFQIAHGELEWPATRLIKRIVDTLPEGDRILHALTPNYDMLFEYACDSVDIPYSTGFCGGVERKMDWHSVDRSMLLPEKNCHRGKMRPTYKHRKHVRLYKVHGSLNFFFHRERLIEHNAWLWCPPTYAQRVMITPGLSKYETLQLHRQELLKFADAAIERENRFLFLGYGFNDKHLEEYIRRKLIAQGCMGLVITRKASSNLSELLKNARNLWAVSECSEKQGTSVFNHNYEQRLDLPGEALWNVDEFTKKILGG